MQSAADWSKIDTHTCAHRQYVYVYKYFSIQILFKYFSKHLTQN